METEWKGTMTVEELLKDTSMGRPHVVVIGAGASVVALPNGDSNGKTLPVMGNLVEVVGLEPVLERNGIEYEGKNFEAIHSELYEKSAYQETLRVIENQIRPYFLELKLPPYLLFQRWMMAGETPCPRAALTTGIPESASLRMRNTCAYVYLLVLTTAFSCNYSTGVSHSKWTYFRGATQLSASLMVWCYSPSG